MKTQLIQKDRQAPFKLPFSWADSQVGKVGQAKREMPQPGGLADSSRWSKRSVDHRIKLGKWISTPKGCEKLSS